MTWAGDGVYVLPARPWWWDIGSFRMRRAWVEADYYNWLATGAHLT